MKQLIKVCDRDIRITGRLLRIARLEGDGYEFLDDLPSMLAGLRSSAARIDLFTATQKLPETEPKYNYPMEWDNFAAVPVTTFDNWWTNQVKPEVRNRVRQATKKGVVVREVPFDDSLLRGICDIYNETPVRQGRRFPHYGKSLEAVRKDEATFLGSSVFIGAFLDDKLIGFVKVTANETRTQANLMNILSLIEHRDKAPTNALIAEAVRACANRGISYLVYQRFAYGKKPLDGIAKFKEVNGFRRIDIPRYYVPLTVVGRIAHRLNLHHRLADNLPESVRARLVGLRNGWYDRVLRTA
jgi:hypothetical protein